VFYEEAWRGRSAGGKLKRLASMANAASFSKLGVPRPDDDDGDDGSGNQKHQSKVREERRSLRLAYRCRGPSPSRTQRTCCSTRRPASGTPQCLLTDARHVTHDTRHRNG
jgi:hypothetical protein